MTPDKTLEELKSAAHKVAVDNDRLTGELARAIAQLEEWKSIASRQMDLINGAAKPSVELREEIEKITAQLEETRKHLLTYGAHTPVCRGADNCDCGFSEVQKGLPATPDFLALLKEVSDRALDNMEGEDLEGHERWAKVHTTAEDLIQAIALAEGRKT